MKTPLVDSTRDLKITGRYILCLCIFHFLLLFFTGFGIIYSSQNMDLKSNEARPSLIKANRYLYLQDS